MDMARVVQGNDQYRQGHGEPGNGSGHPLVGLIRNPRSHRNMGHAPELADDSGVLTRAPANHEELSEALARFAERRISYLAIDGGDGTVRDVLTCGARIFGDDWPELIILPKGKTNALTVDLGLPRKWTLGEALAVAPHGRRVLRRPLTITSQNGEDDILHGFMFGAGAFTLGIEAGQEAHRLGAFNSFAVGVTIGWGILQALFGSNGNAWRRPTPVRLAHKGGPDLPHGPHGTPGERYVVIATTFERFPLGIRPFGRNVEAGMKLGIIDWPLRWLVGLVPAILCGFHPRVVARNGTHRIKVSAIDMDIGGSFILDGEAYPAGRYHLGEGPLLRFVVP